MANTNTVTNYEDPFQLADFAKREGPEGLLRLADYFETTGQQTPLTVKTALAMSRGPGVFPIKGALTSDPTPRVPRAVPGEMDYFEAHPNAEMRASGELYDQKTGQLLAKNISEAMAQSDAPTPSFLRQTIVPDYGSPAGLVTGSLAPSVSGARPAKKDEYDLTEQEIQYEAKGFGITPEQMRAWLAQERSRKQQSASPTASAARPTPARRAAPSPETQGPVPSFTLEDVPSGPIPSYTLEDVAHGPTPEAIAKIARRNVSLTSPIPVKNAPSGSDVSAATASTLPSVTADKPAGKPDGSGKDGMPAPSSEGAGGDASERDLYLARLAAQNAAGFGGMGAGKNIDMGIADTLGERLKQVQALRAKREEQSIVDARDRANNRAQVEYLMQRFPERREALAGLLDMTKAPNFSQMLRVEEQVALDKAKKEDIGAKAEDRAKTQEYRAGTLDLKRDIAKDNRDYRAVQAGLKQAELNLRAAENERKATGSAEPSDKERSAFQASMKPAENTAVSLKDADNLNSLSTGMLVSGKPPPFLTQSDIVSFVGIPPFEGAMRSRLAQSNPQAFDLLTQMARLKTMVGHEYFGSALSPAEAERQRQFLDFGVTDTPDSIARKMKSYHDTLADKATIFLRPRVVGRPLGADWAQATGLDALSAPGGTFAGLLDAPSDTAARTAAPAAPAVERVIMLAPDGKKKAVRADQVDKAKAQGWRMP